MYANSRNKIIWSEVLLTRGSVIVMRENFNLNLNTSLSLEQEFKMRIFQESVATMNPQEARSLLLEASKLLMVKDNIIKGLIRKELE